MMLEKNEKGFTLIELMIVMAIITILAAIVIVPYQHARDKAYDTNLIRDVKSMANFAAGIASEKGQLTSWLDWEKELEGWFLYSKNRLNTRINNVGTVYAIKPLRSGAHAGQYLGISVKGELLYKSTQPVENENWK